MKAALEVAESTLFRQIGNKPATTGIIRYCSFAPRTPTPWEWFAYQCLRGEISGAVLRRIRRNRTLPPPTDRLPCAQPPPQYNFSSTDRLLDQSPPALRTRKPMPVCGTLCALTLSLCAAPVGAVWKYASKNVGTAAQALDAGAEGGTAGGLASILGRDTAYVRLQPSKSAEELKKRSREALILRYRLVVSTWKLLKFYRRQHDLLHANNITMIATEKVDRKDYKIRLQDHKTQFTGAISIGTPGILFIRCL